MEMTIDEAIEFFNGLECHTPQAKDARDVAIDTMKREKLLEDWTKKCRKFEADYENRLKADMVAMLTEIQLEIKEKASAELDRIFADGERFCANLIQQRINSLKAESEG